MSAKINPILNRSVLAAFVTLLIASCASPLDKGPKVLTHEDSIASKKILTTFKEPNKAKVEDSNFIETTDTVSTIGPQSICRNIVQDKNGTIWIASWQGIISYNGKEFTNHTLKSNLRHFHVFSVAEDRMGNMWFGTIGGGAYMYDGKDFKNYTVKDGLVNDFVTCLMPDEIGNVWIGTEGGASYYNNSTGKFLNLTFKEGLCGSQINAINQDAKGRIWFGTYSGISILEKGKKPYDFKNKGDKPFKNVRSIAFDDFGNTYIGSEEGLHKYDGKEVSCEITSFIGYVLNDRKNNLWLSMSENFTCHNGALYDNVVDGNQNSMALYKYKNKRHEKILSKFQSGDSQVFGTFEDKDGNIWIGTMTGVCMYNGKDIKEFAEK